MVQPKSEASEVVKSPKPKQTGMALEMDVMKKIGAQLERLTGEAAKSRALNYVQNVLYTATPPTQPAGPVGLAAKQNGLPFDDEYGLSK